MATKKTATEKEVRMQGAPEWYGKHLDELDFEWSPEEEVEIERYCEKILKNVAEEEMTPLERFKAHMEGKPKDRKLITVETLETYPPRTLDSWADAIKPIDLYKYPKLLVKAKLATVARFKLDFPSENIITYTEEIFGGHAKMIDYGNPGAVGEPPIKTMEDLEGLEVPDPYSVGLFPGWLWAHKELRRIIDKYNLPLPIWSSIGPDPTCVAILGMMGWSGFLQALRKNPELARRCSDLGAEWDIMLGRAMIEVCHPEALYVCQFTGAFPLKGNEWVGDQLREVAKGIKAVDPNIHLSHGYSFLTGVLEWYNVMHERGSMVRELFDGGTGGDVTDVDEKIIMDWHREHDIYLGYGIKTGILEQGPISAIEEACKALCEFGKDHPRFAPGALVVYNTPHAHLDALVAAYKKYASEG
jgi:hypothetical protein